MVESSMIPFYRFDQGETSIHVTVDIRFILLIREERSEHISNGLVM